MSLHLGLKVNLKLFVEKKGCLLINVFKELFNIHDSAQKLGSDHQTL